MKYNIWFSCGSAKKACIKDNVQRAKTLTVLKFWILSSPPIQGWKIIITFKYITIQIFMTVSQWPYEICSKLIIFHFKDSHAFITLNWYNPTNWDILKDFVGQLISKSTSTIINIWYVFKQQSAIGTRHHMCKRQEPN